MARKIFIPYKYGASEVAPLQQSCLDELLFPTTARSYVDRLQDLLAMYPVALELAAFAWSSAGRE